MCKFEKVTVCRKFRKFNNIKYIPPVNKLWNLYSKFLCDDYYNGDNRNDLIGTIDLIESVFPYFWVVLDSENGDFAGFVFLDNLIGSPENIHSAEITTCFVKKYWGNYTKVAAKKFIKYCFKRLKLKKIKAQVFEQNYRVKTILKRSGFVKEATLRAETLKNGKLQNVDVYSVINPNFVK